MKKLEKTILALGLLVAACQPDNSNTEPEDEAYTPILIPQRIILTPVDGTAAGGAAQPVTLMGRAGAAQLSDGTPLFPGEVRVVSPREQAVAGTASAGSFGALVDADSGTETMELVARDPATGLLSEPVRVNVPRLGPDSPSVLPEYDPDTGRGVFVDPDPDHADRVIVEGRGGSADAGAEILVTNLDNGESATATADGDGNFRADIKADPNDTLIVIQVRNDKPGPPLVLPAPPRQCPDERMQVLFGKCRLVSSARPDLIEVPGTAVNPFAIDATNAIAFVSPVYLLTVDGDYQFVKPFDMDLNWAGDLPLDELQDHVRLYFAPRNAGDNKWIERAGVAMGFTRRRVSTEASQLGFFRVGIAVEHLCENHIERNLDPLCFTNAGPGNSPNACAWLAMVLEQCDLQTCGDGFLNLPDEECDDHNSVDGDGCSAACEAEGCGDGVVQSETGETCDDANEINTDACPNGCREARCGDGVVWQGVETCDDGVLNGHPGRCAADCAGTVAAVCGNRVLEGEEQCDDGNSTGGDGCNANCVAEACGNGVLDQGEGCDDGNTVGGDGCAPHCRNERCGDGTQQPGEQCDDNNINPGDGCDENCLTETCGNGITQTGEACDDGDADESDACLNDCRWNLCGDGKLYTGIEVCDGGSIACNDGCYDGTQTCYTDCSGYAPCDPLPQRCGNGSVEGCELCDDGDANGQPGRCSNDCATPGTAVCGNSVVEIGEGCDDGVLNGQPNKCDATCVGTTAPVCGNAVTEYGEQCDDGALNGLTGLCNLTCNELCDTQISNVLAMRFGDGADQTGYSLAQDSQGNIWLSGYFTGIVNFGGGPLTSAGGNDVFIAKFDSAGNHLFSKRFGDSSHQFGLTMAIDPSDNVWIGGQFQGTLDFGGGPVQCMGATDIFVAKLSPNGNHLYSQRFGGGGNLTADAIATSPNGDAWLTGHVGGSVDFGGGILPSGPGADHDIYLVKLSPTGNHLYSARFGDALDNQDGSGIAIDGGGNVWLTGMFAGTVDFGGGLLVSAGVNDIYIAKFNQSGGHLMSRRFGDADDQHSYSITLDGTGDAWITGWFQGKLDMGAGPMVSAGMGDAYVAKFNSSGNILFSRRFGVAANQWGFQIRADSAKRAWVIGQFGGSIDLGDGPLTSAGNTDVFLAAFDPSGYSLFSTGFGGGGLDLGHSISLTGNGSIWASGLFSGTMSVGGIPVSSAGGKDIFLTRMEVTLPSACYHCGNAIFEPGETCDDGALNGQPNQCDATCTGTTDAVCGNGVTEPGETCDDGANGDACDGCLDDCTAHTVNCGNGIAECGEGCDDGDTSNCTLACNADCTGAAPTTPSICGNGIAECGEPCDDGTTNGPELLGDYNTQGFAFDALESGDRAYAADGLSGLATFDISRPAPTWLGSQPTPTYAMGLAASGSRLFLATFTSGLRIYDLSGALPTLAGSYDTAGDAWNVAVSGNRAFVADGSAGLSVLDISNRSPALIAVLDTPGSASDIVVSGNRALVADGSGGLRLYDITSPIPVPLGTLSTPDVAYALATDGVRAWAALGNAGLWTVQMSGAVPVLLSQVALPGVSRSVSVNGSLLYVGDSAGNMVRMFDVTGDTPQPLGSYTATGPVIGVSQAGSRAYLAEGSSGIQILAFTAAGEGVCLSDCSGLQTCGDGFKNGVEVCDDGDLSNCTAGCNDRCSGPAAPVCGDGIAECGEVCDDGNNAPCGGPCNETCTAPYAATCGNGATECGEACDDGDANNCTPACNATCSGAAPAHCGNGVVDCAEACDDGDATNCTSGCNATCTGPASAHCGNGVVDCGEVCDDGNNSFCGGPCNGTCTALNPFVCGNSTVECGEACDDGPGQGEGLCADDCGGVQVCGDGMVHGSEQCDDGAANGNNGQCSADCIGLCNTATSLTHVSAEVSISDIAADSDGNYYISSFDNGRLTLRKVNSQGNTLWQWTSSGAGNVYANVRERGMMKVAVDGNLFIAVHLHCSQTFNGTEFIHPCNLDWNDETTVVIKISPDGSVVWAKEFNRGLEYPDMRELVIDSNGDIVIAGSFSHRLHAIKVNGETGVLIWDKRGDGGKSQFTNVGVDAQGNAYLGGARGSNTVQVFDGVTLENKYGGVSEPLVIKINAAGNVDWIVEWDGYPGGFASISTAVDFQFYDMEVSADGRVYVGGRTEYLKIGSFMYEQIYGRWSAYALGITSAGQIAWHREFSPVPRNSDGNDQAGVLHMAMLESGDPVYFMTHQGLLALEPGIVESTPTWIWARLDGLNGRVKAHGGIPGLNLDVSYTQMSEVQGTGSATMPVAVYISQWYLSLLTINQLPGCPYCGNEELDSGEMCDSGPDCGQAFACACDCSGITPPHCGNSVVEPGESCDDGNPAPCGGTCNETCTGYYPAPTCGNGNVECGEACDLGIANGACGGCDASCHLALPCPVSVPQVSIANGDMDNAGNGVCVIGLDGALDCTGGFGPALTAPGPFSRISAQYSHLCAIRVDGSLAYCDYSWYFKGAPASGPYVQVDPGYEHACMLLTDGMIDCWGDNQYGQLEVPYANYKAVTSGRFFSCGLRTDGNATCWGATHSGALNVSLGPFVKISAGYGHVCAIAPGGVLSCWGDNYYSQALPPAGTFIDVNCGIHESCGVRTDGSLVCWGYQTSGMILPTGNFLSVVVEGGIACAVRDDMQVICWDRQGQSIPSPY